MASEVIHEAVRVDVGVVSVDGDLRVPDRAAGLVIFAHGSGSSRFSRRNRAVAGVLEAATDDRVPAGAPDHIEAIERPLLEPDAGSCSAARS